MMSVSYPAEPTKPYGDRVQAPRADLTHNEPFVPVYARRGKARGGQGKIKTWMILTPVAGLVLGGIGAMLVMGGSDEASVPLVEPGATAPVLSVMPTEAAVVPLTTASTPEPVVAAPPAIRAAAPMRRAAPVPVRREAVRTATATRAPAATPRIATPAPAAPTGPQSYTPAPASPSTSTLNAAPMAPAPATPVPTPPPPIIVEPVG